MIDLDQSWRTERLELEPLTVEHATELAPVLDDTALHEFTGGAPLAPAALAARYARLAERRSPDGHQLWGNWVMRVRGTGMAVGTVQVTLPPGGPADGPAEVAWVVGPQAQGRGYAKEAASGLVALLREAGWTVIAHIHPAHLASQRVARAAGLSPTKEVHDGEVRWALPSGAAAEEAMFVIRAAVPGDMSALRDVFRRSSLSNDGDRANLLAHPDVLELSDLAVREGRTRAAVADGRIVGFATWLAAGNVVEIEDLFVAPERMRQGIGRALVLDLIAIAWPAGRAAFERYWAAELAGIRIDPSVCDYLNRLIGLEYLPWLSSAMIPVCSMRQERLTVDRAGSVFADALGLPVTPAPSVSGSFGVVATLT